METTDDDLHIETGETRPDKPDGIQLELFTGPIVHYYDRAGALRSGRLIKRVRRGKRRGAFVVADASGRLTVTAKIRNIELDEKTRSPHKRKN
jgi:hypothetical protein